MATITTINATDKVKDSRAVINTNLANLNTDKLEAADIAGKVDGPASATNERIAIFDGTTGKKVKDGGKLLTDKAETSDLTSHTGNTSNPHTVTKAQVELTNVTDDAQLKRASGDINSFDEKSTPVDNDLILIEDSAASNAKKKVKMSNLPAPTGDGGRIGSYRRGASWNVPTLTTYLRLFDAGVMSTESDAEMLMPAAGTIKNLYFDCSGNTTDGTVIITVRVNGVNTDVVASLGQGTTSANSGNDTATVAVGDRVTLQRTHSGVTEGIITGPTAAYMFYSS